ncbi:piggyBac transposable element-derived protein 2-like [Macrobrachium rosenbergii]|uniref:piggyBac transposable element-derived protein 2-like n=1 Tax=Macrobrachium rosenbergii TaxID=79674 RepID=UPI0034D6192C
MSPDIYDHIVKETVRYATASRNKLDFVFGVDELKSLIGILLLPSYHKLPSERHYWSKDEDLGVSVVKKAMSRNKFQVLKSVVHFCDNADAENNKGDKGFKVRSLISKLQKPFIQYGVFEECISVDEMMVKYDGHNSLKQFIQVKPIRFRYKLWALCGTSGYC